MVSLNGALQPFRGAAGQIFPAMARLLFLNPVASQLFAWRAGRPGAVERLLENTGSKIDAAGLEFYGRLLRTTGHIEGALGMMASWDLRPLIEREGGLPRPLTLVVGERDQAVPPQRRAERRGRHTRRDNRVVAGPRSSGSRRGARPRRCDCSGGLR